MRLLLVCVLLCTGCQSLGVPLWAERRWYKAALHTHTVHSDGEATPEAMLRWYRRNGYSIVALTDHNRNTPLAASLPRDGLLVIPGVEFTSRGGGKPVHMGGLFSTFDVKGLTAQTPAAALAAMFSDLTRRGALAIVNHPNYEYGLTLTDVAGVNARLLEVYNGSSSVLNDGDQHTPPVEALWDGLLRSGRRVYGVATDDAHALPGGANPNVPGKAWVMLYARLEPFDVREALEQGRFYATTGPLLTKFRPSRGGLYARVGEQPGVAYVWRITGGAAPAVVTGPAVWVARPAAGYRRATLRASDGSRVYLQPVFAD